MKKIFIVAFMLIILYRQSPSQNWTFVEDFAYGMHPHGVVVTLDDKIWVGYYRQIDEYITPGGDVLESKPIWVLNPDGTLFKKIHVLKYNSEEYPIVNGCRGLSLDHEGNVLFIEWDTLWKINYKTYEAMKMIVPNSGKSLTEAACDRNGNIFITHVAPLGKPIYIYDKDFHFKGYVAENVNTIQRSIVVTPNGKNVFIGRIYGGDEGNGIIHYRSKSGPGGIYEIVAVYQPEIWGQCLDIDSKGLLWVGSFWDVGANDLDGWYGLDFRKQFSIVDRIGDNVAISPFGGPHPPPLGTYYAPRGAAWSRDGKTLYTADFDGHVVKKWTSEGIWKEVQNELSDIKNSVPMTLTLKQNYPNPFNPTTTIGFSIPEDISVSLKVFDVLGSEVATLVNKEQPQGNYEIEFDGSDLTSGIYFYRLQAGDASTGSAQGFVETKKMILLK